MSWSALTLVTDLELGQLEPQAVHHTQPWGEISWPSARSEAKRDLKIWIEADYSANVPHVADKIRDRFVPAYVFGETSGAFTDYTTAARDDTDDDLPLKTIFATFGTDALYIASDFEFEGVFLQLLESVNASASVLTAQYWAGGTGWTSLSASDGTAVSGATFGASGRITWVIPSNWERRDVNNTGSTWFWARLRISAAIDAGTAARQCLPIRAPDGLKRVAAHLALYHVLNGLDMAAGGGRKDWADKAAMYYNRARDLYDRLKARGGIPMDVDQSGAIDPPREREGLAGFSASLRLDRA